ncbi:MAG TPA: sugar phosphate isomerase/epimerase [Kiritimatiellia bacterium]|nr:sugar phosphate isomerase/epimerase [Kiritimatiellia bacterium]
MKLGQVACQLYTVRDHLQKPADIAATLRRVREIGYTAVQLSGLGPVKNEDLAQMLKDAGLTCCASHEPGEQLLGEPQRVIEKLRLLNCRIAAYPWPGTNPPFGSEKDVREFARQLNATGRVLHDAGIAFCYHNHHMEFRRVGNRTVLEMIYAETDAAFVKVELDTYWVQFGGGDPAAWCRRMKGRLVNLHMKDYAVNDSNQVVFAEVGSGNLDWPGIIAAADAAGCQWFLVEQDTCPGNPFESLKKSYDFVQGHLV